MAASVGEKSVTLLPQKPLLQISVSLVVAAASCHFVETEFRNRKDRMRQTEDVEGSRRW